MGNIAPVVDSTRKANVALVQGNLVKLSSGEWIKTSAKGEDADGIVLTDCAAGSAAQVALLSGTVHALVLLGTGGCSAGDEITPSTVGTGLKSNTDQEGVVGVALVAGSAGELVPVKLRPKRQIKGRKILIPLGLASITDGTAYSQVLGFRFRIVSTRYVPSTKTSTAAKATTLTPKNGSTALTGATPGGQLALTTATTNALGTNIEGATVTDDSTALFAASDTLNLIASATTAFGEGAGTVEILVA